MSSKPHIIFVPGAWHSPACFDQTATYLQSKGYVTKGIHLKSVGASPPLENFDPDVETIASEIKASTSSGSDVVLVMHSYGGVPGCEAVKDFVSSSGSNNTGVVSHLIFCCAFALPKGVSLFDALGGNPLPWFQVFDDDKQVTPATPGETFYNDVSKEEQEKWAKTLKPHSYNAFKSKVTFPAWQVLGDEKSTYLYCEKDMAIPVSAQRGMVESSGIKFKTESLDASHSPFLSMPEKTGDAIRRAAGEEF